MFLLAMTSSTKYLLAHGNTNADNLLMTMRIRPMKRSFLRGQIMVLKTFPMEIRGFFADASMYARYDEEAGILFYDEFEE